MARALLKLASDPALRARMGETARLQAQSDFALDLCVARYAQLYRSLAANRR
jgi:glycosyltransferase involved in cell wall biosynthesis